MKKKGILVLGVVLFLLVAIVPAQAIQFDVRITNLTNAIWFTPLLVTAHNAGTHLFQAGSAASVNMRAVAECGDLTGMVTALGGADADTIVNPAAGTLAPGLTTTATLNNTTTGNGYLSIVAMLVPTNDGFVGLDALTIPGNSGTYIYYLWGYDAGTEANNELLVAPPCAVGVLGMPGDPGGNSGTGGTGVTTVETNATIHIHRGNLGDLVDPGGISDLFANIHRWHNPVARIEIVIP